ARRVHGRRRGVQPAHDVRRHVPARNVHLLRGQPRNAPVGGVSTPSGTATPSHSAGISWPATISGTPSPFSTPTAGLRNPPPTQPTPPRSVRGRSRPPARRRPPHPVRARLRTLPGVSSRPSAAAPPPPLPP